MTRQSQSGLTMIELVVAATVAAMMIVAVLGGLTEIEQLNRTARAQTIATEVVQQELEKVRNSPYANITTGATDLSAALSPYPTLENPRNFTKTVTVVDAGGLFNYARKTGMISRESNTVPAA